VSDNLHRILDGDLHRILDGNKHLVNARPPISWNDGRDLPVATAAIYAALGLLVDHSPNSSEENELLRLDRARLQAVLDVNAGLADVLRRARLQESATDPSSEEAD
jgi:hypothetical protein